MEEQIRKIIASHDFICNKKKCNDADGCNVNEELLLLIKEREEKIIGGIEELDQFPASQSRTEKNYLVLKDEVIQLIKEESK